MFSTIQHPPTNQHQINQTNRSKGNAMKYATAQTVAMYGLHHKNATAKPVWIAAFVFATLYQYAWDVFVDWDLVSKSECSTD
jgi:hypothetical protein